MFDIEGMEATNLAHKLKISSLFPPEVGGVLLTVLHKVTVSECY